MAYAFGPGWSSSNLGRLDSASKPAAPIRTNRTTSTHAALIVAARGNHEHAHVKPSISLSASALVWDGWRLRDRRLRGTPRSSNVPGVTPSKWRIMYIMLYSGDMGFRQPRLSSVATAATVRPPNQGPVLRSDGPFGAFRRRLSHVWRAASPHRGRFRRSEPGERVCLIGRNGAGKSTTLKLIAGTQEPDDGAVEMPARLRWSMLEQKLADESAELVRDFVARGMARQLERIAEFERLTAASSDDRAALRDLEALQREIDAGGGWNIDVRIKTVISELGLPAELPHERAVRRLAPARGARPGARVRTRAAAARRADQSSRHQYDRVARGRRAERIPAPCCSSLTTAASSRKSPRGSSISIAASCAAGPAATATTSTQKAKSDEEEDRQNALFDKKLAEEEIWVRKGVKARQTRNEGRVRALEELRDVRAERIKRPARGARSDQRIAPKFPAARSSRFATSRTATTAERC